MIPSHILSEVIDRLATPLVPQRTIDRVLSAVGIDFDKSLRPPSDLEETVEHSGSASTYSGSTEFDVIIFVEGHVAQHRCRAVYRQEIDDDTGVMSVSSARMPTRTQWEYQVLDWDAESPAEEAHGVAGRRDAPQWIAATLVNLIPRVAELQITDTIEMDALRRDAAI